MKKSIMLFVMISWIILFSAFSASAQDIEYVNSILWSNVYTISIENNFAYCGFTNGVLILDISDPENIRQVSQVYLGSPVLDLDLDGEYLYAAAYGHGLRVIDISDPYSPSEVSGFNIKQPISIEIYRQSAFIIANTMPYWGSSYTLKSYNISNPSNPEFIDEICIESRFRSMTIKDGRAYIAENYGWGVGSGGVRIISIYYPGYFFNNGRYETTRYTQKVISNGEYFYLLDNALGLLVIETLTPYNMHVVNYIIPPGDTLFTFTRDFCIDDNKVSL